MKQGFIKVAAVTVDIRVADVWHNCKEICKRMKEAEKAGAKIIVFPELCLTGYTCSDLFTQDILLKEVRRALAKVAEETRHTEALVFVGLPLAIDGELYNVAAALNDGKILGFTTKTFLPNYNEFYEKRWFSSARELSTDHICASELLGSVKCDYDIPLGNNLIYHLPDAFCFGAEICEDLWAPIPPSAFMAMSGAELILNLSASNDTIGKREYREKLVKEKSTSLMCTYLYASAGANESTTDLIFSGHCMICEGGKMLAENSGIAENNYLLVADIDIERIQADRLKGKTYQDCAGTYGSAVSMRQILIPVSEAFESDGSLRSVNPHPFTPGDTTRRQKRCMDIFHMQIGGLAKRLSICGGKMVIGVSGGMDSTLSLLVAAQTLKKMGLPATNLTGITMPAFGTTNRTYQNSLTLMQTLGITVKEIPIKDACITHYADIGHDMEIKDITYENVQARERTQVLMDYANKIGAIVVGTGDLSELALGWCTYNADQMSMYGVNASIPKTLVKWMIASVIECNIFPDSTEVLKDIIDTPISPELLPPDEHGNIVQKTEDSVGPYELHDFFLYYVMRFGYSPEKIFHLAKRAFAGIYDAATILKWMKMFYRRFFAQQFKRSCMPDGVKVGSVCLSPRGDWRMPSDASVQIWMRQLEKLAD